MPKLTKENLATYYDLTPMKESDEITVLVGKKKSTNLEEDHPPFVLFKQGLGAKEDYNATVQLQKTGIHGILPALAVGEDYFIRAGYPDKHAIKWAAVEGQAAQIMDDAINLSLGMLHAGIIDRDRKVLIGSTDINAKNLVISNGRVVFFDFEPERIIDWTKPLTYADELGITKWKEMHEGIIKNLAINLHLSQKRTDELMAQFHGTAGKILGEKGEQAAQIWKDLMTPPVDDLGGSYEPPSIGKVSLPNVTAIEPVRVTPISSLPPPPKVGDIFALLQAHIIRRSAFSPPAEAVIERMARLAHRYSSNKSESEPNVYSALEQMIKVHIPEKLRPESTSLVNGMKAYLDKAYSTQLHDKDELGARPRGPWGPSG